jgi:hypothetical protein
MLTTFSKTSIGRDQLILLLQGNSVTFFLPFLADRYQIES